MAETGKSILKAEKITYTYMPGTPFEHQALYGIDMEIYKGEFFCLIGHTGCGKSTLIQTFDGLIHPDSGNLTINGLVLNKENEREVRKNVGLVFQYPEYQLFEETVYKDIAFGLNREHLSEEETKERVLEAAKIVGLGEDVLQSSIYELSGGQKRRAAIAGVIVMRPRILIMDEPCAGLDPAGRNEILTFIKNLQIQKGTTIILVSHSMAEVAKYADRVAVMYKGHVKMTGTPAEIFKNEKELEQYGLEVPQVTKLVNKLNILLAQKGIPELKNIYTVENASDELYELLK